MSDENDRWVEVPEIARSLKAWFQDRPGQAVIDEIRAYIAEGRDPVLWRGHTHTDPPREDPVVYLLEFEIPRKPGDETRLAPCPCCTPNHRKYGKGMVAWFPVEGVIRLIGSTCFKGLNKEGHEQALAQLAREQRERSEINFLLGNGDKLIKARDSVLQAHAVATAIDHFGVSLRNLVNDRLNMPLWTQTKNGELFVWDGKTRRRYATVRGTEILNPSPTRFGYRLKQFSVALNLISDLDQWELQVRTMPDETRREYAKLISKSLSGARTLFAGMRERQAFVSQETVSTLRAWGVREDAVYGLVFERNGDMLRIGRPGKAVMAVRIPAEMENDLPPLDAPLLNEVVREEERQQALKAA